MSKGSGRRPGEGYENGWDRIFGNKNERANDSGVDGESSGGARQTTQGALNETGNRRDENINLHAGNGNTGKESP